MTENIDPGPPDLPEPDYTYIGTTIGGDPTTLDELEEWLKNTVQSEVDSVSKDLQKVTDDLYEVWFDPMAGTVHDMLDRGRKDVNELADRVDTVGGLIGGCASALRSSQSRLDGVAHAAQGTDLVVLEQCHVA